VSAEKKIRVALIHDWLTGMRGGEYVLEAIVDLFPEAELFTLIYDEGKVSPKIASLKRHTSWLQKIPGAVERYRHFLPLMPAAIESFDLSGFDLIVSSSHCVAKGVKKAPEAVHVSYVHAPMRYIWDRYDDYFGKGKSSPMVRLAACAVRGKLQRWDRQASSVARVDRLIANSQFIAQQIERAYGRKASVVYPFADLSRFTLPRQPGPDYLMVGAFAPYKRVDLAIEAFNRLKLPLKIVGSGQDEKKLRAMAGPTVEFLGTRSNEEITRLFATCRAFVFPGLEDFGITPVEAMAAGAPVIAYGEGGGSETVTSDTGVLFKPQTVEALMDAILRIEQGSAKITSHACIQRASQFSREAFQRGFLREIQQAWVEAGKKLPSSLPSL
jgi:glycosyltransferase involved in cell wall biosynthesis